MEACRFVLSLERITTVVQESKRAFALSLQDGQTLIVRARSEAERPLFIEAIRYAEALVVRLHIATSRVP